MRTPNEKVEKAVVSRWSCDPSTGQLCKDCVPHIVKPVCIKGKSYLHVWVAGCKVRAHRLVWRLCNGDWPTHDIDHINGDGLDNRLVNLRDVPAQVNNRNKRFAARALPTGVYAVKRKLGVSFFAEVGVKGKQLRGPCRSSIAEALADRLRMLSENGYYELHGAALFPEQTQEENHSLMIEVLSRARARQEGA